ncbi:MAG: Hint domain-containing protein [Leptolyngbya sp. SIO1E4]|nr:Hint domain-containing protein [Leptolyngbya sp. SIO1E4]
MRHLIRFLTATVVFFIITLFAFDGSALAQVSPSPDIASGSWGDSVEISLPPGVNGTAPTIAIRHDHRTTDGPLGAGFQLLGSSIITRHSAKGGIPLHGRGDETSQFRMDGQPLYGKRTGSLLPELAINTDLSSYEFEPETFTGEIITFDRASQTWLRRNNGWKWKYGAQDKVKRSDKGFTICPLGGNVCSTAAWYLDYVEDDSQNQITFSYRNPAVPERLRNQFNQATTQEFLLSQITYNSGQARIDFSYEEREDPRLSLADGVTTLRVHRLERITVRSGEQIWARYRMEYENSADGVKGLQTLLKRIVRESVNGDGEAQILRTNTFHHSQFSFSEEEKIELGEESSSEPGNRYPIDLNHDGVSDLITLGYDGNTPAHRVYIATPEKNRAFVGRAEARGTTRDLIVALEDKLAELLTIEHAIRGLGFAVGDLDNNGNVEFLVEKPRSANDGDKSDIVIVRQNGDNSLEVIDNDTLPGCALRFGQFMDVNADQLPDLIVMAHDKSGACAALETTQWVKNDGSFPIIVWRDRQNMAMPLEGQLPPGLRVTQQLCRSSINLDEFAWLPRKDPYDPDSEGDNLSTYGRWGHFNDDGVLDFAQSFHTCYRLRDIGEGVPEDSSLSREYCKFWEQQPDSLFSRIYYGVGDGTFVDSGLHAGDALIEHFSGLITDTPSLCDSSFISRTLTSIDLDRNGKPEIIRSDPSGRSLQAAYDQGLDDGFNLSNDSLNPTDIVWDELYRRGSFGDFNGDGFTDILDVRGSSIYIQYGTPSVSEGRLIATKNSLGGKTELSWGFTAESDHDNPGLAMNLEVLNSIKGANGETTLRYAGGTRSQRDFNGFETVEVTNDRGARTEYGFYTDRGRKFRPKYGIRYRLDNSVEHVSVFIDGIRNDRDSYSSPIVPPYNSQRLRQCDYELGEDSIQLAILKVLTNECHRFGDDGFTVREPLLDLNSLPVDWWSPSSSLNRRQQFCSASSGPSRPSGASGTLPLCSNITLDNLEQTTLSGTDIADRFLPDRRLQEPLLRPEPKSEDYRWPIPRDIVVPSMSPVPSGTGGTSGEAQKKGYVKDFYWSDNNHRLERTVNHRDIATERDDLTTTFTWEQPRSNNPWYRLVSREVRDIDNILWTRQTRTDFDRAHFDRPKTRTICGKNGAECQTTKYRWNSDGTLRQRQNPGGDTESWTYAACGKIASHTDEANRTRQVTYDDKCRPESESWLGRTTSRTYDGFNRTVDLRQDPGANQPAIANRRLYNNSPRIIADRTFQEPNRAYLREGDGQLVLVYWDEYGRLTRRELCEASNQNPQNIAEATCIDAPVVQQWIGYSTDGHIKAKSGAFGVGELSPTTAFTRDERGRARLIQTPAPNSAQAAWNKTFTAFGPGWRKIQDPINRTWLERLSTLSTELEIDGSLERRENRNAFGLVESLEGPGGQEMLYRYNGLNLLRRVKDVDEIGCWQRNGTFDICQRVWEIAYDDRNRPITKIDFDGIGERVVLDNVGRILERYHVNSTEEELLDEYQYRDRSNPRQVLHKDEAGNLFRQQIDGFGRTIRAEVHRPDGELLSTAQWTFDDAGHLETLEDANQRVHRYQWDVRDYLVSEQSPSAGEITYTRSGNGQLLSETDADGIEQHYTYDYARFLQERQLGDRTLEALTYDNVGRVSEAYRNGVRTGYTFDEFDDLTQVNYGLDENDAPASTVSIGYDSRHRMTTRQTSPVAGSTATEQWVYNDWDLPDVYTPPRGGTITSEYDRRSNVFAVTDEAGYLQRTEFDSRNRVTQAEVPGADPVLYAYEAGGELLGLTGLYSQASRDGEGSQTTNFFDALGRLVITQFPDDTKLRYQYDGNQLVAKQWLNGLGETQRETRYQYAEDTGRLTAELGPANPADFGGDVYSTQYEYSPAARVLGVQTPGEVTRFTYDRTLGLTETEQYSGLTERYFYEEDYPWVTRMDLEGTNDTRTTEYQRDSAGRTTRIVTATGNPARRERQVFRSFNAYGQPEVTIHYGEDGPQVNQRWRYELDGLPQARETVVDGTIIGTTHWNYFPNGVLESEELPSGATTHYDYDPTFDYTLDRVHDGAGTTFAEIRKRNGRGQIVSMDVDDSRREFRYDELGRNIRRWTRDRNGDLLNSWQAQFDDFGQMVEERFTEAGETWGNTYTYDPIGRLIAETQGRSGTTYEYTLDLAGNRLSTIATDDSGTASTTSMAYDSNLLTSVDGLPLEYDSFNQVIVDQHQNRYDYTPGGLPSAITHDDGQPVTAKFWQDAEGLPIVQRISSSSTKTNRYTHWDLDPAALPLEMSTVGGETDRYITADGQLVARVTTDAKGKQVRRDLEQDATGSLEFLNGTALGEATAFGIQTADLTDGDEPFAFHQMESLPQIPGIYLSRLRTYDAQTGRFLAPDPLGLYGGQNRYLYGAGDPVNYADPLGLEPVIIDGVEFDLPDSTIAALQNVSKDFSQSFVPNFSLPSSPWACSAPSYCHGGSRVFEGPGDISDSDADSEWKVTSIETPEDRNETILTAEKVETTEGVSGSTAEIFQNGTTGSESGLTGDSFPNLDGSAKSSETFQGAYAEQRDKFLGAAAEGISTSAGTYLAFNIGIAKGVANGAIGIGKQGLSALDMNYIVHREVMGAFGYEPIISYQPQSAFGTIADSYIQKLHTGEGFGEAVGSTANDIATGVYNGAEAAYHEGVDAYQEAIAGDPTRLAGLAGTAAGEIGFELLTGGLGTASKGAKFSRFVDNAGDAARLRPKPDSPCCFVAGTQVKTADGHMVIEDLRAGDLVWSWDHSRFGEDARPPAQRTEAEMKLALAREPRTSRGPPLPRIAIGARQPDLETVVSVDKALIAQEVQRFNPRTGKFDWVATSTLQPGDEFLTAGHLHNLSATGDIKRFDTVTADQLSNTHQSGSIHETQPPAPEDTVWVPEAQGNTSAGHHLLATLPSGTEAVFQNRQYRIEGDDASRALVETGLVLQPIEATFIRPDRPVWDLVVRAKDGTEQTITGTPDHPFYVPAKNLYVPLESLQTVWQLRASHGNLLTVLDVRDTKHQEETYNFTVEETHNFFVADLNQNSADALVHNTNCPLIPGASKLIDDVASAAKERLPDFPNPLNSSIRYQYKNWTTRLFRMTGKSPPAGIWPFKWHGHHILFKSGNGPKQKALVIEGATILARRANIDWVTSLHNLIFAPNGVTGMHGRPRLQSLVNDLKAMDAVNGSPKDFIELLRLHGEAAAQVRP